MRNPVTPPAARQPRIQPKRIARQPDLPHLPTARVFHHDPKHRGVQVEMQVTIDMIEGQSCPEKLLELCSDFPFELLATSWIEEKLHSRRHGTIRKPLLRVDKVWNLTLAQR